jgi:hypothetical protein
VGSRVVAAGLVCACMLGLALGCGEGEPEKPTGVTAGTWAANFCRALTDGTRERAQAGVKYLGRFHTVRDPRSARASLVTYTQILVRKTDATLAQMRRVGPPAIEDGAAVQADVERAFLAMRAAMARALADARALPVTNRRVLNRAFVQLTKRFEREIEEAGELFNRVGDIPELDRAVGAEPACQTR